MGGTAGTNAGTCSITGDVGKAGGAIEVEEKMVASPAGSKLASDQACSGTEITGGDVGPAAAAGASAGDSGLAAASADGQGDGVPASVSTSGMSLGGKDKATEESPRG